MLSKEIQLHSVHVNALRWSVTEPVRLIGLSSSSFQPEATGQLPLLDPTTVRRERLARATDALARRFGDDTVVPAALAPSRPRRRRSPGAADTV